MSSCVIEFDEDLLMVEVSYTARRNGNVTEISLDLVSVQVQIQGDDVEVLDRLSKVQVESIEERCKEYLEKEGAFREELER